MPSRHSIASALIDMLLLGIGAVALKVVIDSRDERVMKEIDIVYQAHIGELLDEQAEVLGAPDRLPVDINDPNFVNRYGCEVPANEAPADYQGVKDIRGNFHAAFKLVGDPKRGYVLVPLREERMFKACPPKSLQRPIP